MATSIVKGKKILVFDQGLYSEEALRFVRDGAEVFYYVPWADAFPRANKALIGKNFDGLKRILNFWDYVDQADLIFFPDTHSGDMVEYLKRQGKRVFGAGKGEIVELDRWKCRQIQKAVGLPTQKTIKIKGIIPLKEYLKENENLFIKLDIFRGDVESFFHSDYEESLPKLIDLEHVLGPKVNEVEFILEEPIKGVEAGFDGIVVDGQFLSPCMYGYEKKGDGYVGRICNYEDLPSPLKDINDGFSEVFKKFKTRSFFSTEAMCNENGGYMIDPTVRLPAPVGCAAMSELIENWSDVIWYASEGKAIKPIMKYKYVAGVSFESEWAKDHWVKVNFPPEIRKWLKFQMVAKFDNEYWTVPEYTNIFTVIALGNTIDECVKLVQERSAMIKATGVNTSLTGGLDSISKEISEGKKYGINF